MKKILLACAVLVLVGCDPPVKEVAAKQPIAFPHKAHLEYLTSGKHKEEGIQVHVKAGVIGSADEAPDEMKRGECATCHDTLAEKTKCAGCHSIVQDEKLKKREDVRPCVGCHRQVWSGGIASIPSTNVCRCCHSDEKPRTKSDEEKRLREYLTQGNDVPWVRINTLPPHVHFSHSAHVRLGTLACTRCHEDMTQKTAPPTQVKVFSMSNCLGCHKDNKATLDCVGCHQ